MGRTCNTHDVDGRFSRRWRLTSRFSGLWRRVVLW